MYKQGSADLYLMCLDMRPKTNMESIAGLQHLKAIPFNHGLIQDCGWGRDVFQILADKSLTKCLVRWQGKESFRIECHPLCYLLLWT